MNTTEIAITVKDLRIRYKTIQAYSIRKNLLKLKKTNTEYFEAVKGISFEVPKGQILGITGKNGSGKSTLLRALAGIFSADDGFVDLHGNSVSLLALGIGFQPKLTGMENIFLSGILLGFTEAKIKAKLKDIISFAGLGDFINKPVRTYSSGMRSKLAFSITVVLETDIMLVDEVLSVGDAKFKKKSFNKMKELINDKDRTVVIVSHSSDSLRQLCDNVMWLNDGEIKMLGEANEVLDAYAEYVRDEKKKKHEKEKLYVESEEVKVKENKQKEKYHRKRFKED